MDITDSMNSKPPEIIWPAVENASINITLVNTLTRTSHML